MAKPGQPYDICWCECHRPTDSRGVPVDSKHVNLWPKYDDMYGRLSACALCWPEHEAYVEAIKPSSPIIFIP